MLDFSGLNWLAILVATVASFVLGGFWYGRLFGKAWLAAISKTEEDLKPIPAPFIISFFTALITAIVLAMFIQALDIASLSAGIKVGLLIGIGFIATAMASDSAFCGWGLKLWSIQAGYRVVYSVIMGMILAGWQ
jgi:hypothetical protein